ncbi:MAG: hypothetical protein LBR60_02905 [Fibrobacter sp.]|jgi:hypothetical protein|nr:hypothetical protein [Fibrobacter sp.]
MKKILALAMLFAVSSAFAAWDMFPAKEAGRGEVKLGVQYDMPAEKLSYLGLNFGVRYTIIDGLEAAIMLRGNHYTGHGGFVVTSDYDGNDVEEKGIDLPIVGVRYWLPMGVGFFADVALPLGSEDRVSDDPPTVLNAGVQFSTHFTEELSLGSEVSVFKAFNDYDPGMDLKVAAELDYAISIVTPKVGADFVTGITKGDRSETEPLGVGFSAGVTVDITEMLYVDVGAWVGVIGNRYNDDTPITLSTDFGVNF